MRASLILAPFLLSLTHASPLLRRSISNGPVIDENFPDPGWIQDGDTFYAFSTNAHGHHIPMATSPDFKTWTVKAGYDALPTVGDWSTGANVWAPDVVRLVRALQPCLSETNLLY